MRVLLESSHLRMPIFQVFFALMKPKEKKIRVHGKLMESSLNNKIRRRETTYSNVQAELWLYGSSLF